ncbi:hypothetical protein M3204_21965 [Mesobacillus subterraneus]|uniref:hypothetical protein n=1 Tax=Mesobacillus subterraneus TaxID=285983 RepID=UPI00203C2DAA|nr:hypothetical protein [Mesobacillus subterraneus]MCM3667073.1 hypothetical protein [Mesobacillus subterraneus]MCM3685008.1 hypothetical protein [Mesobacillus subterraneus]
MNFRQLIITGFIAGAAILMPDIAFAEKGPDDKKPGQPLTAVQPTLPDKAENAKTSEKKPAEPVVQKHQVQIKPVNDKPAQAKIVVKPAEIGNSNGQAKSVNKNEKASKVNLIKKTHQEKRDSAKEFEDRSNKQLNKAAVKSIHNESEYAKDTKRKSPGLKEKVEPSQDSTVTPVSQKRTVTVESGQAPPSERDERDSSQKESSPKRENVPNLPSRTKTSGGSSSDRTSNGNTSTAFSDKWFVWDEYFNVNLLHPFTSRVAVYRSQWVNAPPSPPPLQAPVFLPYTDAISHG